MTKATFRTKIFQAEGKNATGIRVPNDVVAALGKGKRPPVKVTVNGYTYPSTVANYGETYLLPFAKEHRDATGIQAGDEVEVTLELETTPRTVTLPDDLAAALDAQPGAREAFDRLAPSARKEHVRQVETAKAQETRERRIAKIVASVSGS